MARKDTPHKSDAAPAARPDPRKAIVEALLRLAAVQPFEDIRISDVAKEAGVGLADFRDAFPSKGAVLAGFSRMIDRAVLEGNSDDLAGETGKDRLFDALMRRLDAMAPYKAGLQGVTEWARRDPSAAFALNGVLVNSMRFMMETAGLDHEGLAGSMKLQGLVLVWTRVLDVWFADDDPGLAGTMAALDRELERGGGFARRLDDLHRLAAPLRTFAAALCDTRRRMAGRRADEAAREPDLEAEPAPRMRGGWPRDDEGPVIKPA
ncbi:MAG: TetR/AcrR family transcriptional regulator [Rhizobiales bacterium]|nr:TetR/AcrR family transcriptional regulator [Hyphomicrobiales bacterium]